MPNSGPGRLMSPPLKREIQRAAAILQLAQPNLFLGIIDACAQVSFLFTLAHSSCVEVFRVRDLGGIPMLRSSLYAIGIRTLCVLCFFLPFATLLHAQPATVWSYKGSVLTLSQTDASVVITYQTLSDALMKSGAHVGDPLFRGQRVGNSLKGKAYRFFGPQCQPMGFGVEGSIEGNQIILRGIAPGLGFNSCKVETTYYDTLLLTVVAAPGETQQATLSPTEAAAFQANTVPRYAEMKAVAVSPTATFSRLYLAFPFRCVIRNGEIVFQSSTELYYHEALDYRPAAPFDICPANADLSACRRYELTGLRLVCQGGIASAPALTLARPAEQIKLVRLQGDALLLPFYTGPRASLGPDNMYQAPAGLGLLPKPTYVISADDFVSMYDPVRTQVALPRSFFLTLANWFPVPQLVCIPLLFAAIVLAFCGF